MTTFDTTQWYRHVVSGLARPLVPNTDVDGYICVVLADGRYATVLAARIYPIPERLTVERRIPKEGEDFAASSGAVITAFKDYQLEQWVIVENGATT